MRYLLDTNHAYVLLTRPALPAQKRMDIAFLLCTPVLGELWFLVHNSRMKEKNHHDLVELTRRVDVVDYDTRFVEEFGQVRTELKKGGRSIPHVDVQLAAIARVLGLPVLTADRHLDFISGVTTENWLA